MVFSLNENLSRHTVEKGLQGVQPHNLAGRSFKLGFRRNIPQLRR
jgi:hypothetical protein